MTLLKYLRAYRVVSMLLTIFTIYWGYQSFLFVNAHYENITDFVVAFYISIVGLAGWCIKHWMGTQAHTE